MKSTDLIKHDAFQGACLLTLRKNKRMQGYRNNGCETISSTQGSIVLEMFALVVCWVGLKYSPMLYWPTFWSSMNPVNESNLLHGLILIWLMWNWSKADSHWNPGMYFDQNTLRFFWAANTFLPLAPRPFVGYSLKSLC